MNGHKKFHKANGPAFISGEIWYSVSGNSKVEIISVRKFGEEKWDYEVTYIQSDGTIHSKDAWNFQIRYEHPADKNIHKKEI